MSKVRLLLPKRNWHFLVTLIFAKKKKKEKYIFDDNQMFLYFFIYFYDMGIVIAATKIKFFKKK